MWIFACDPGIRTGFAFGVAGEIPRSGTVILKEKKDPIELVPANLAIWLKREFTMQRPDIIIAERYLHPGAQFSAAPVISSLMISGAIRAMAGVYGVRVEEPAAATVRHHFCGKANAGDRTSTNLMVLRQAIAVGYVPRDSLDLDRANACSLFDYASAHYARKAPAVLTLFGEGARA